MTHRFEPRTHRVSGCSPYEALDPWEQSMILASLQRVADMMDAGDLDASPVLHVGTIDPAMPPA